MLALLTFPFSFFFGAGPRSKSATIDDGFVLDGASRAITTLSVRGRRGQRQ